MKRALKLLLVLALPCRWWMIFSAALGFLTIGSGVGLMMTSAYIISRAALHPSVAELQVAIVGVRFFGLTRAVFRYFERLTAHRVTLNLLAQFRVWFFAAAEPLAPARLALTKSGDLLSRVVTDVEALQNFYIRVLAPPLIALLVAMLMWGVFGVFAKSLALLLLVFMLLAGCVVPLLTLRLTRGIGSRRVMLESELSVLALEGIQGLADLMVFGRAKAHFDQFGEKHDELLELTRRQKRILALNEALIGLLMNGAVLAIFLAAAPRIENGSLDGVYLAVLALGVMAAFEAMMPLPAAVVFLEEMERAAERLFEIIGAGPASRRLAPAAFGSISTEPSASAAAPAQKEWISKEEATLYGISPLSGIEPHAVKKGAPANEADTAEVLCPWAEPGAPALEFRAVTFRYAATEAPVLREFSLTVPQGARIVITGPSGAGKSTLANLLLRFWEFEAGEILIGGRSVRLLPATRLPSLISLAPQRLFYFSTTLRENLLLARPQASADELIEVCSLVGLHRLIAALPAGYETLLGEGGVRLSGGERRRLGIARALLKGAPILVLDEPTAHLDAAQEAAIWALLAGLAPAMTVVVLSHRLPAAEGGRFQVVEMAQLQLHPGAGVPVL